MELQTHEGWLFIRLRPEERAADLDWGRFVRWKVPEADRVHVPDLDLWAVRAGHRDLVERLFGIYRAVRAAGVDPARLRGVQALIDDVERRYPGPDAPNQERFRAWLREFGRN